MAKRKQEKIQHKPTKRQVARWQREKRRQRIIFGSAILVVVAVLSIIGAGFYTTNYRPLHQTVITVNDTRFDMNYYINMLKIYGQNQSPTQLYSAANEVANIIELNELMRQGAAGLGITVSDDEVDKALAESEPPLSNNYQEVVRTQILANKLLDEYFDAKVPVSAEQRQIMVMLLESEGQALEVKSRLEAGEDFAKLAGELSLDSVSKGKKGDLGWHPRDILAQLLDTSVPADFAFNSEVGVLSQPLYDEAKIKSVGYWLIGVIEEKADYDEVRLQGMLLSSEEEANSVKSKLESGEDFAKLAGEYSQLDKAEENGGDLGWVSPGLLSSALDDYIFKNKEAQPGVISKPIRDDNVATKGGYWLVKVLANEDDRKIDDEDRSTLKNKALNDWVEELKADPETKIERFLNDEKIQFAIGKATAGSD